MVASAMTSSSGGAELGTLTVVDKAKVKHDLHIMFFDRAVTLASADNAAVDVADAQMALGYIGTVAVAEADYTTVLASSTSATKLPAFFFNTAGGKHLYYLLVCRDSGGCDYGAVGDLVFRLAIRE